MRVLCLDPSGNFDEGSGTTGWSMYVDQILVDFGSVAAKDYSCQESYWSGVAHLIGPEVDVVVCESYRLFAHKSHQQHGSSLETPQLIGHLRMVCWNLAIDFIFQDPSDKVRVADDQLVKLGVLEKKGNKHYCLGRSTVIHERDAIRHGVYYHRYGKGKSA